MKTVLSAGSALVRRFSVAEDTGGARAPRQPRSGRHGPVVIVAGADRRRRHQLSRQLRRNGYVVCHVPDGPSAYAAAAEQPPAAVVMEWLMPGSGGTDVCQRMRQHPLLRRLPVVLLAARGDGDQIAEGFRAGADEVLTRPVDATELIVFLDRTLPWADGRRGRA